MEFNVDLRQWKLSQDTNLPLHNSKGIDIMMNPLAHTHRGHGFPLDLPGVDPIFYDWKGKVL